jgi:Outer membrane protein and related peptidoglycan-associated (lipo)proteins
VRRTVKFPALMVALLVTGFAAHAQVPERLGMFGHIDGRWMWLGGERIETAQITEQRITNGPGGQALVGYKLSRQWDVALASDVQGMLTQITQLRGGTLSTDANRQHFDLEVGYSGDWWRINGGLRGLRFAQYASLNIPGANSNAQRMIMGIGPKVGFGARGALTDSWAIIGGLDMALLYGMIDDTGNGQPISSGSYTRLVPQAAAEIGLSWRSADTPSLALTVGARVAASFNTTIVGNGTLTGTLVEYGPFLRFAYNFSGPARIKPVPVATAPEGAAAAPRNLTVFFDFDRADISPVAAGVIRQAAIDARRGHPANIQVTSHADRSGDDLCNGALSLRRANAIKDELLRQGLDATQISMIGRDEGKPLVPTANGVQEAQNRQVQISF